MIVRAFLAIYTIFVIGVNIYGWYILGEDFKFMYNGIFSKTFSKVIWGFLISGIFALGGLLYLLK